ncbi:hypothetical protein STEG23_034350 [Scotinomys teguina]
MARKAGQGKEEEESRARQQEEKTPVRDEEKTPACDGRGHHVVEQGRQDKEEEEAGQEKEGEEAECDRCKREVFSFVYDYEKCQLLAAPIYFREDMGIEEPADGVNFYCGKKMPCCEKGEQQDSATFKMLHHKKGEQRRTSSGLHHLRKVNSAEPTVNSGDGRVYTQELLTAWRIPDQFC